MKATGKILSILMSVVLVMGLMPLPAFADSSLRAGVLAEPQEEAAEPESSPLQEAGDAAGSALSVLGANVMGAISALGNVQDDPVVLDSGTCGENLTWEYWDDARLVISGTGEMDNYTGSDQPWNEHLRNIERVVASEGVTSIGNYAFYGCWVLVDVELPNTLSRIGNNAFGTTKGLPSFEMPDSVTELGTAVFTGAIALETCHVSNNLTIIPSSTFSGCNKLVDVNMPETVDTIGAAAFAGCWVLKHLELPDHLTSIGAQAFKDMKFDSTVVIPGTVTYIGSYAFEWVEIDGGVVFSEGVKELPYVTFSSATLNWVQIPASMTNFNPNSMYRAKGVERYVVAEGNPTYCSIDGVLYEKAINEEAESGYDLRLQKFPSGYPANEFSIPDGVVTISANAFQSCKGLEKIFIPESVIDAGNMNVASETYDTGAKLQRIDVSEDNSYYSSIDGVLLTKDKKKLVRCPDAYPGCYSMPASVETLASLAFFCCLSLNDIAISPNITEIPDSCFYGCQNLVNFYIPKSVNKIGRYVFYRDYPWNPHKRVYYGGSQVDWAAITIASGNDDLAATSMHYDVAFYAATDDGLSFVLGADGSSTIKANEAIAGSAVRDMVDYESGAAPWAGWADELISVKVEASVGRIGDRAFSGCSKLESVELSSSVASVGKSAFTGCPKLTEVQCKGAPFDVYGASLPEASFDGDAVTLVCNDQDASWFDTSTYDSSASTWNGYRLRVEALPVLSSVELEKESFHVRGFGHESQTQGITVLSEKGQDLSDSVAVQVTMPERVGKVSSGRRNNPYYASDSYDVVYNAESNTIVVGDCIPAGEYVVTVTPVDGQAQGEAIEACFNVTRDAERMSIPSYSPNPSVVTIATVGGRTSATQQWNAFTFYVENQYGEDVTSRCVPRFVDIQTGEDVTDATVDMGFRYDDATKSIYVDRMAQSRTYRITAYPTDESLSGTMVYLGSIVRNPSLLNVPYALALSGGENTIELGSADQWASSPYRVRVLDPFDDPCWPRLAWTVADSSGADVSQFFKVDEQGYLFVDAGVRDILAEGDNEFTVMCAADEASDTAPLVIRVAPEEVAPATHTATFKAGNEVVGEVVFAEGDASLEEPSVPQRENYIGSWEEYNLASATGDITVNAVYAPIDPDAVSEVGGEATADYDKSVVTVNLAAAAATRQVKVESEATKPVDVVMVLDQSGSMADKLGASQTKHDALVECANAFARQLYDNAEKTGADHRVALVGFAYSAYRPASVKSKETEYKNTGLLAGADGAKTFPSLSSSDYAGALLPIKDDDGINQAVVTGIDSIKAEGATAADVGLKIARNVFSENPVATAEDGTPERERIVVFITDGVPTSWGQTASLVRETAAGAVAMAKGIKQGQGARIYSVGVDAEANPVATFNSVPDGVVTGPNDAFKSYDFNRFLHAVSSDYPAASGMADLGDGSKDAGYYMAVNDTSNLGKIFRSILYSTVYSIETFDRAALSYTLPNGFVLTMRQEEEMRAALAGQGLTDDDIVVTTAGDGKMTITFRNVKVSPETVEGVVKYVARVSFQVTVGKDVSGPVSAGSAAVEQNGETAAIEVPAVEVPDDRCLVVFKVNDAIYEVREASIGDEIELPSTNLARWLDLEKMQEQGTAQVSGAYAVFETSTLTRSYNVAWTVGENSVTTSFKPGEAVAVPDQVLAWVPEGFVLAGWSPALPVTMPVRNISATAVLTPEHVHDYSHSTYQTGSCDEGIVTHHVCVCGEETTEQTAAKAHDYEAVLSSAGQYGTTVEKLVCKDCGHSVDKHITYSVSRSSFWNAAVLDLNLYEGEVVRNGASDDDISLCFYVGNAVGKTYTVTRIDADGKRTSYTTRVENGYLTFDPDHFSVYVIGEGGGRDGGLTYEEALEALEGGELPEVTGEPESVEDAPDAIDISGAQIATIPDQQYDGIEKRPAVSVMLDGAAVPAEAYTVEYSNNVSAGIATVTVKGEGVYEGKATATFEIKPAPSSISLAAQSKTYTGEALAYSGEVTRSGSGGEVTYAYYSDPACKREVKAADVRAAGDYYVRATLAADKNHGAATSASARFTLDRAPLASAKVSGLGARTYDGKAQTQSPTVELAGKALKAGSDYALSYANNVNAGTATVTVTGQGNYAGTKTATFQIGRASVKGATVTGLKARTYTGGRLAQSPKVALGKTTLEPGRDYELSYRNNVNAGTATVTVTGKGNYSGSASKSFKIAKAANPLKVSGKKATVKYSKRKAQTVKASKAYTFKKKAIGKVIYSRVKKGSSKWLPKVNAKTGAITVKAGAPKGKTQKVRVKVTAKGNGNYRAASKVVTVKVKIK